MPVIRFMKKMELSCLLGIFLVFAVHRLGEESVRAPLSLYVPLEMWLLGAVSPLLQHTLQNQPHALCRFQIAGAF